MKRPKLSLNNPQGVWLNNYVDEAQKKKAFLVISCMVYVCNKVTPGHHIRSKIKDLFQNNPNIPVFKLGFGNNWEQQDLWL
jgi:abortive infection bacteriophage resistance protein